MAGTAAASTATIDFEGGTNVGSYDGSGFASGTWFEAGFAVEWRTVDVFPDPFVPGAGPSPYPSDQPPVRTLANTDAGAAPRTLSMTVSRPDGRDFSLTDIVASSTYEGLLTVARFTPYDRQGNLDAAAATTYEGPILRPTIALTGERDDGTVSETELFSGSAASYDPNFVLGFGEEDVALSHETLSDFSDLNSLTLSHPEILDLDAAVADGLNELGAPQSIVDAYMACTATGTFLFDVPCEVGNQGVLELAIDSTQGFQNWTSAVGIDSLTFEVAPIPLPASAWALLAGLLGLAGLARRRRRATG
ncbi:MAG: VPLPA-CTERM sorting domain-containing protein [Paracoccaceae bacterium]|nr:VPLPA-CTERM sorting domain-containing protein [Paracoccaceae bacterium]